jgi:hypothetical protein
LVLSTLAVMLAAAAAGAGWFIVGHDDAGGPLQDQFDGGRYGVCGSGVPGTRFSFGASFSNPADGELVIRDVSLQKIDGMVSVGMMRIPLNGQDAAVGALPGYPADDLPPAVLERAQPVDGLVLAPGEHAHIVLGFELLAAGGRADGLVVRYEVGGRTYEAVNRDYFFVLAESCDLEAGWSALTTAS